MKPIFAMLAGAALLAAVPHGRADPGEQRFRDLYRELVETNTTLSSGSCTLAAERMAARLRAAGFTDSDLHLFAVADHPKEGGLVAIYPGRDPKAKAILLLAHLDVVEAKREDWARDPFKLIEENGYFYGRGVSDDKSQVAIWVDTLIRYREERFRPRRTVKMALTCGEEAGAGFNGARWLVQNRRELIDAAFALNEDGAGELDGEGHRVSLQVEAGQKTYQDYTLEVTNPGGHSSRPVKDNAIYRLAAALGRIAAYEFPAQFSDANRFYFAGLAKMQAAKGKAALAAAMAALVRSPGDAAAIALVAASDPGWNSMLRTTCVATMLEAGHAANALPQRARANVNCRIFPGVSQQVVRAELERLVADPAVKVTLAESSGPPPPPPPLTPQIMGPIEKLAAEFWPGVPVLPTLETGASDAIHLSAAGIPTYGIDGLFVGPDFANIHGLNEYVGVQMLLDDRAFLYRLVKLYAEQP